MVCPPLEVNDKNSVNYLREKAYISLQLLASYPPRDKVSTEKNIIKEEWSMFKERKEMFDSLLQVN